MTTYNNDHQQMNYLCHGTGDKIFIWAHGWAQSLDYVKDLSESLGFMGTHYLVDFPGFGQSPQPKEDWAVGDYAEYMKGFLKTLKAPQVIWIGHSFGSRVGMKLANQHPELISHLILLAAPGLPRRRPWYQQFYFKTKIWIYKLLKHLLPFESARLRLRQFFGSADYKNAGPMHKIFMNVIREDLGKTAGGIQVPTLLIYGRNDNETPPDIGARFVKLIPRAELRILDDLDHYSVLSNGKHQVSQLIKSFIN